MISHGKKTRAGSRRHFLADSGRLMLSGTAIGLLAGVRLGHASGQASADDTGTDIQILNTAIAAEHEAVAAYQLGADSGLLNSEVLQVAVTFQGHHRAHVDALSTAVKRLGGEPLAPKKQYYFPVEKIKNQGDVLSFAAGLERGAISAYAGAIPLFDNRDLSQAAASILADESMHWAVLRQALGLDPVPGAFFS
ncbi:DUF4439 domain-containing protein [Seongchinamella sediminis]|uniref:DUF4439 domain-containing protein n=1 Tax=Seongchinamella sediminis TaxID=2283635 RepID=A0A3L7DVN5_9GAMM|nr:ferritin-like domain-containing protein [Seongchinamella sediminis]RLQ20363.1 DUF4439 domain-containing protein [Seongchinamella sediminis]